MKTVTWLRPSGKKSAVYHLVRVHKLKTLAQMTIQSPTPVPTFRHPVSPAPGIADIWLLYLLKLRNIVTTARVLWTEKERKGQPSSSPGGQKGAEEVHPKGQKTVLGGFP